MRRTLVTSLLIVLGLTFSAYAGTWEQRGADWYYLDASGNPTVGRFYDEAGDIYYADASGRCLTGEVPSEASGTQGDDYYGDDCRLRPAITGTDFEELAVKFCNGEGISLETRDIRKFGLYYKRQVTFGSMDKFVYHTENGVLINTEPVDRDALINMLISRVGPIYGNTIEEKIVDATIKVANAIRYNIDDMYMTLEQTVTEGAGTCWNYSRVLEEVLQHEGISAEVVPGCVYNRDYWDGHWWVRTWVDNHWVYSDPTFVNGTGNALYANIPYDIYLRDYRMGKY